jgi:hypothetical protein
MAETDTIQIPGIAQPVPKWAVFAGLGGVAMAIILYYRNKNQAAQQAAATPTDQYPPDGTVGNPADPYSTDPATGQTYGDEAIGSGGIYGAFSPGGGYGGTGWDPNTGLYTDPNGNTCTNPGADGYCPGSGGGPPFSTNDAWSLWVIQQMQSLNPNLNVTDLTNALGLYLAGQPVDPAQKTLILDAEAIGGPPPVAGPNGYPPNVRVNGNKGGGHNAVNPVTGLKQTGFKGSTGADISWDPSPHATSYQVTSDKGTVSMTGTTSALIAGIGPAHAQATVSVLAKPAAAGAVPAKIVVHVKRKAR